MYVEDHDRVYTYTEVSDYGFLVREYAYGVLVLFLWFTRYLKISKQG